MARTIADEIQVRGRRRAVTRGHRRVPQRGGTCMRRMFTLLHRRLLSVATTHIPRTRMSASARHLFKGGNCGNRELEDAPFCRKCSSVDRAFVVVTSVRHMSEVCSSPDATITLTRGHSQKRTFGAIVIF